MMLSAAIFGLKSYQLWIILIGSLAGAAAGIIGSFLVLRKSALMGDGISHAVLPGIAMGAWFSGSLSSPLVMLGAIAIGVLTPYLVELLQSSGRLHGDASLGIVFTVLFSLGVIMVSRMDNVHLDVDCVLFGEIATALLDQVVWGGRVWGPRVVWVLGGVLLLNVGFIALFYKELKLSTFDRGLAYAMGLRPQALHYGLLGLVALTTIAAFESVGAIIVVAMLIAPGAIAYLLTDRLGVMLLLAGVMGVLCAVLGVGLAEGFGGEVSVAGSMAVAAGGLFGLAFLFSPRSGVFVRAWRRMRLRDRLAREHILMCLFRADERGQEWVEERDAVASDADAQAATRAIQRLLREGQVLSEAGKLRLTPAGLKAASRLVRAHRLWEAYLQNRLGLPADHVHPAADDIEHFLTPELQAQLAQTLEDPSLDPHGKPIPK